MKVGLRLPFTSPGFDNASIHEDENAEGNQTRSRIISKVIRFERAEEHNSSTDPLVFDRARQSSSKQVYPVEER
jgi:hypothetical protein